MKSPIKFASACVGLAVILACGGSDTDFLGNPVPEIYRIYPCQGQPGDLVEVYGKGFNGLNENVYVGDDLATVTLRSGGHIRLVVPGGAGGQVRVGNSTGVASFPEPFVIGPTVVPEVENNDNIDGSNATEVKAAKASGTLDSLGDRDHFRFRCLHPVRSGFGHSYNFVITMSPRLVDVIYVDGVAVTLNSAGSAVLPDPKPPGSGNTLLVGVTGATGSYTLQVRP